MHNNLLILICVSEEENNNAIYSMDGHNLFYNTQTHESAIVKWELHPGQKQLHYGAKTYLTFCKNLHRQHSNAKQAKNPEGH